MDTKLCWIILYILCLKEFPHDMLKLILKTSFYSVKNNHWRSINFIEMGQNNHSRHSYRFLLIILNPAVFFLLTEFPLHISPPGLRRIKLNISPLPPPPRLWPVEHQSRAGKYERRIIQTVISFQWVYFCSILKEKL